MKKTILFIFLITGLMFTVMAQAGENTNNIKALKKACDGWKQGEKNKPKTSIKNRPPIPICVVLRHRIGLQNAWSSPI